MATFGPHHFWSAPLLARTNFWPRPLFFDQTVLCPNLCELDPKKPWPMGLLFGICCSCLVFFGPWTSLRRPTPLCRTPHPKTPLCGTHHRCVVCRCCCVALRCVVLCFALSCGVSVLCVIKIFVPPSSAGRMLDFGQFDFGQFDFGQSNKRCFLFFCFFILYLYFLPLRTSSSNQTLTFKHQNTLTNRIEPDLSLTVSNISAYNFRVPDPFAPDPQPRTPSAGPPPLVPPLKCSLLMCFLSPKNEVFILSSHSWKKNKRSMKSILKKKRMEKKPKKKNPKKM